MIAGVRLTVSKIIQNVMRILLSFSGNVYNLPRNFGDLLDPRGALIRKQPSKGELKVMILVFPAEDMGFKFSS